MLIKSKKIFWSVVSIIIVLAAIYLIDRFYYHFPDISFSSTWMQKFDLDDEGNIPTWLSTTLLIGVAITSWVISLNLKKSSPGDHRASTFWAIFGSFYLFLSFDEGAAVHELFGLVFNLRWVYFYAPLGLAFFLLSARYFIFQQSDSKTRLWILGGLMIYAFSGLFLEFLFDVISMDYILTSFEIAFEESGEMLGTLFVLMGCIRVLNLQCKNLSSQTNLNTMTLPG